MENIGNERTSAKAALGAIYSDRPRLANSFPIGLSAPKMKGSLKSFPTIFPSSQLLRRRCPLQVPPETPSLPQDRLMIDRGAAKDGRALSSRRLNESRSAEMVSAWKESEARAKAVCHRDIPSGLPSRTCIVNI